MSTAFIDGPALPARLASLLGRNRLPITLGRSHASVWRFDGEGETLFLKAEPIHPLGELPVRSPA